MRSYLFACDLNARSLKWNDVWEETKKWNKNKTRANGKEIRLCVALKRQKPIGFSANFTAANQLPFPLISFGSDWNMKFYILTKDKAINGDLDVCFAHCFLWLFTVKKQHSSSNGPVDYLIMVVGYKSDKWNISFISLRILCSVVTMLPCYTCRDNRHTN